MGTWLPEEERGGRGLIVIPGEYDVIDPPWKIGAIKLTEKPFKHSESLPYETMTEDELAALSLPMAEDCHVFCWATQSTLPAAIRLLEAWDARYSCCFVWHKEGGYQPFRLPAFNCEFAVYGRHGSPDFVDRTKFATCFKAPRAAHSVKPEGFYDMDRRVTADRRLDMFNRRKIEGFDGWGLESPQDNPDMDQSHQGKLF